MNRNVNLLLALVSLLALFLVTLSAIGFIVLNGLWMHSRKRKPKPLIDRAMPVTLIMAMVFPFAIILSAALPLIAPNGDYGLMLIMAGVWTGLTLQSARAALKQG